MTDEAPYGYIDDDPEKGPRTKPFRGGAEFGMAARRAFRESLFNKPLTQEEIDEWKMATANWEGFLSGENEERKRIIAIIEGRRDTHYGFVNGALDAGVEPSENIYTAIAELNAILREIGEPKCVSSQPA